MPWTHDQNPVQELLDNGEISPAEAASSAPQRHKRALGGAADAAALERFLLCSDGPL